ncbi:MAG: TlpA family protein disulfide reductase [Myxococcales bacterium]|nr:TlpA family protein disulfide reductase [Myxococcales bacterium]
MTIPLLVGKGALRVRDVGQRVVVSFFSRYCRPCFRELPILYRVVRAANKGRDAKRKIAFIVIAADGQPPPAFLKQLGNDARWLIDHSGVAAAAFRPRRFPCTYIAKDGKIAKINRGFGSGYGARVARWLSQVFPRAKRAP